MKRFCVIGLGNFGFHVARTLYEEGHEVVAIDLDQEKIHLIQDHVTYAMVGDASSEELLRCQGVGEMDAVVVSTGERSHLATLITLHLREMGVPRILVKAHDEDHGHILAKVGATDIILPEKDMAVKIALGLSTPNILDFLPLAEDFSVTEVAPPDHFVGRSLVDLDLRRKFNITVIGIKDLLTDEFITLPPATYVVKDNDLLVLIGKSGDVERACRKK